MKVFHLYNRYHYGDHIFNLRFLNAISTLLQEDVIQIYYYYDAGYIKNVYEIEAYIRCPHIKLKPLPAPMHQEHVHEIWIGHPRSGLAHFTWIAYFDVFYQDLLRILGIPSNGISTSIFQDEPYLLERYEQLDTKYKGVEILLLNAPSMSFIMKETSQDWKELAYFFQLHYKVVTTHHVDDEIPCTMRDGLTLQDIGAISTHARYIVGTHSGPMAACYTSHTKKSVKKWFVFQPSIQHHNPDFVDNCTMKMVYDFFIHIPR